MHCDGSEIRDRVATFSPRAKPSSRYSAARKKPLMHTGLVRTSMVLAFMRALAAHAQANPARREEDLLKQSHRVNHPHDLGRVAPNSNRRRSANPTSTASCSRRFARAAEA
ncbi:MAG: hypothetical protein LC659_14415, partial [Myxococcales bacterium]|nr:hypothetical protein [Myxococcales bacterium]